MDTKHVNFSISSARERSNGSIQLAPLQIGQQFTARVLQAQAEGQLVIEVNRQSYIANSDLPLAAGQEFPVQVMQAGEPIQLKILGDGQQSTVENLLLAELIQAKSELATASTQLEPGTLLTLLKQIADTENPILSAAQIQQLQKLLTPIPIGPESQRLQQSLKNFVENSGIFFEAKLRTLIESLPLASPLALPKMAGDLKVLLGNLQTAAARAEIAKRILELARANEIPVHHDPALIEILSKMDLEEHIPPQCYRVVAELLAFIYRVQALNSERKCHPQEGREP